MSNETIITEILDRMEGKADLTKLKAVLYMVLDDYEIEEKCRDLMVMEQSWQEDLKRFLIRKHLDGKSDRTIANYKYHIGRLLSQINKPIKDITTGDLIKYMTIYKELNIRPVSNVYLNNIRLVISSFFSWQHNKGYIPTNPTKGLDPIKVEKRIKKGFSDEELEKLRRNCSKERDLAIIEFLYSTGVRVSELCALNIKDVDIRDKCVVVYGKGAKERETYLTEVSCYHLKKYLKGRKDSNEALFVGVNAPHERLTPVGVEEMLRRIGKTSNVSNVHPHRFRRTMATNILRKGMALEEVKSLLGHVKIETTLIYTTLDKEAIKFNHKKFMAA